MNRRSTFMTGIALLAILSLASCSVGSATDGSNSLSVSVSNELSEEIIKHTVRFCLDGELVKTLSVADGSKMSAPSSDELPKGYIVDHWYVLEGSLKSPWSFSGGTVTSDLDLYADFEYETYAVTLLSPNGADTYGTSVSYKQAYDFSNYYDKKLRHFENEEGTIFAVSGTWALTHGETLTPVFDEMAITYDFYEIARHLTSDYWLGDCIRIQDVSNPNPSFALGKPSELNVPLDDASKVGYRFEGWFDLDSSLGKFIKLDNVSFYDVCFERQYVYGLFSKLYSISVTSEDETKGKAGFVGKEVNSAGIIDDITVKATPAEGLVFKGWYNGDGHFLGRENPCSFRMPSNDLALEARFMTKAEEAEYRRALGVDPVIDSTSNTLTYGLYPQTHVSDEDTIESLNALASEYGDGWRDLNGEHHAWYCLNDEYYAKKEADPYYSSFVFDDGATIVEGTTYWFKCEPIAWKILSSSDGVYSLVSTVLLDAHRYNKYYSGTWGYGCYADNYANSEIREWLNDDFYDSAFSLGNSDILETAVDNSADTADKVYLLSYKDYLNADYGFSTDYWIDTARECKTTDWARANGGFYNSDTSSSYLYNGFYWTRSPSGFRYYVEVVSYDGSIQGGGVDFNRVNRSYVSVRPGLRIKVA